MIKSKGYAILILLFFVLLKLGILAFWPGWEMTEIPSTSSTLYAETKEDKADEGATEEAYSKDTLKTLLIAIEERQKEMDKREESIRIKEDRLDLLKDDLEAKFVKLTGLKESIDKSMKEIENFNKKRVDHLVKIYESMPVEDAAVRVEKLSQDIALKLLYQMKGRKAGNILGLMEPDKAVRLSQELAKQKKVKSKR